MGYIYVEDGGKIRVTNYYGDLILGQGAEIEFEDWDDALIGAKTADDHPRLIWQSYEEPVQYYEIHRKYGTSAWDEDYDTTSNTTYIDSSINLNPPGGQSGVDIKYRVAARYYQGKELGSDQSTEVEYQAKGSEIEKMASNIVIIKEYGLEQNHPNPFNPTTTITYQVPKVTHVKLTIYDILGKEVKVLVNETKEMGRFSISFDASQLASGTYIYRIESGKFVETKKMVLLK